MKKIIINISLIFTLPLIADVSQINDKLKQQMIEGNSYKYNCPVKISDLRLVSIKYLDFHNKTKLGHLIVHKRVANEVDLIFKEIYSSSYPIEKMYLINKYNGSDDESMKNNNTSAFNCRLMTGSKTKWSKHSYGKAIDINPIQNPYVSKNSKKILPIEGKAYIGNKRKHINNSSLDRAIILPNDKIVKIFNKYGWIWGGSWKTLKDYQHFEKKYNKKRIKKVNIKKLFDADLF
jgi:poly-gamma-glutamate synthesis protein (capsule biosynthesis protein)